MFFCHTFFFTVFSLASLWRHALLPHINYSSMDCASLYTLRSFRRYHLLHTRDSDRSNSISISFKYFQYFQFFSPPYAAHFFLHCTVHCVAWSHPPFVQYVCYAGRRSCNRVAYRPIFAPGSPAIKFLLSQSYGGQGDRRLMYFHCLLNFCFFLRNCLFTGIPCALNGPYYSTVLTYPSFFLSPLSRRLVLLVILLVPSEPILLVATPITCITLTINQSTDFKFPLWYTLCR